VIFGGPLRDRPAHEGPSLDTEEAGPDSFSFRVAGLRPNHGGMGRHGMTSDCIPGGNRGRSAGEREKKHAEGRAGGVIWGSPQSGAKTTGTDPGEGGGAMSNRGLGVGREGRGRKGRGGRTALKTFRERRSGGYGGRVPGRGGGAKGRGFGATFHPVSLAGNIARGAGKSHTTKGSPGDHNPGPPQKRANERSGGYPPPRHRQRETNDGGRRPHRVKADPHHEGSDGCVGHVRCATRGAGWIVACEYRTGRVIPPRGGK